jgi:hypothetical protein
MVIVNSFTPGITSNTAICIGGSASLTATGGTAYVWSTLSPFSGIAVNPTVTTNYSVAGTDLNGCPGSASVIVTVNPLPAVTAVASRTAMCKDEFVLLTASGANTYSWSNTVNSATQNVSPPVNNTTVFNVTGIDINNCVGSASVAVKVNPCTGLSENNNDLNISIYPNPTSRMLHVRVERSGTMVLQVMSAVGQIVLSEKLISIDSQFDFSELPNGVYFVRIYDNNQPAYLSRFIKQ